MNVPNFEIPLPENWPEYYWLTIDQDGIYLYEQPDKPRLDPSGTYFASGYMESVIEFTSCVPIKPHLFKIENGQLIEVTPE